jgi:ribosomal protein S7
MPYSSQECRRQALACVRLAQASASAKEREMFARLAKTWLSLAEDLEATDAKLESADAAAPS